MSEFKGTLGETKVKIGDIGVEVITDETHICLIASDNKTHQEVIENAYLIVDAFKVRQQIKCELSQLLEHHSQMLEMLKEMNDSLIWCLEKLQENGNPYEVDFQLASECDKLIQQATTI